MYSDRIKSYILLLKYMLLGFVFFNACQLYGGNAIVLSIFAAAIGLLAANDTARRFRKPSLRIEILTLFFSFAGAALLKYFVPGIGSTVYIFVPLFELFTLKTNQIKILLLIHAAVYFTALFLADIPFDVPKMANAGTSTLLYLGVACMSWLLRINWQEKEEITLLNQELSQSNHKLAEYARRTEELTAAAERSRVAQELHDSLGHSLMALSMHLDYADKIWGERPEQAKAVLDKARDLSKKSAEDLREAVEMLHARRQASDLKNSISELAQSFSALEQVNIHYELDEALEQMNAEVKNCIYKTVREALTNGLKHGKATAFEICAQIKGRAVFLTISDNGIGCANLTESTGLAGIRGRVEALGGKAFWRGGCGFETTDTIPVSGEVPDD